MLRFILKLLFVLAVVEATILAFAEPAGALVPPI